MDIYDKLDLILNEIKKHYGRMPDDKEWKRICRIVTGGNGVDSGNDVYKDDPFFNGLQNGLQNEGYIEKYYNKDEKQEYFIATIKGLTFIGFKKYYRKQKYDPIWKRFWSISIPLIGVYLGWILGRPLKQDLEYHVRVKVDSLKLHSVDTIYLLNHKATKDTSLVRLVKLKTKPKH